MTTKTLEAPDISCGHCIQTIESAVTKVPGVRFISGDPETKLVTIELADEAELAAVEQAMEEEGYPVKK